MRPSFVSVRQNSALSEATAMSQVATRPTPPARCTELADRTRKAQPDVDLDVHLYSDSHHGFDSTQPVRFRSDVSSGVSPKGVHSGGNRTARSAALAEIDAFLASRIGPARNPGSPPPGTPTLR
jgi:dienelactone hydrolase